MEPIPIPNQYKYITDKAVLDIMDAATLLWPIIRELGESFECENDEFVVVIKRRPQTKTES